MSITRKSIALISIILILDQVLKIWIKTNLSMGQEINVLGNWFILHFTENNGMAFGMDLPGINGKIILSVFRMIAIAGIIYFLVRLIKQHSEPGLIISISLILSGAVGNMIDSAFYGIMFSDSFGRVASIFPSDGGYSSFLEGRVVDMLYFPVIKGTLPAWLPLWGNRYFVFFRPVFNIADTAITIGVFLILIFQKRFFKTAESKILSARTGERA